MKRTLISLFIWIVTASTFGQGLVSFFNTASTLVSVEGFDSGGSTSHPWAAGDFYFGLMTAGVGTMDPKQFTFSGVYATNSSVAGRIPGGVVAVPGWAAGTSKSFAIVGWSSSFGHEWNQAWMNGNFPGAGYFGISGIGSGQAGGFTGTETLPNLNLFGGSLGIQGAFILNKVVPEPSTLAMLTVGMTTLLLRRRWSVPVPSS